MYTQKTLVTQSIKTLTRIICQVDDAELSKVPAHGPLILVSNHINFLDAPLVYSHLYPRKMTGYAKIETWDNPIIGKLFSIWEAIPVHRGEADTQAIRKGIEMLQQGWIVAIAPEGTRSGHGRLQKAHPGMVTLALHSGAPLLPLVLYGGELFRDNLRRLRRTPIKLRVGQQFSLDVPSGQPVNRAVREQMATEIMQQLAALMPAQYHGVYTAPTQPPLYLRFQD